MNQSNTENNKENTIGTGSIFENNNFINDMKECKLKQIESNNHEEHTI